MVIFFFIKMLGLGFEIRYEDRKQDELSLYNILTDSALDIQNCELIFLRTDRLADMLVYRHDCTVAYLHIDILA